MGGYYSHYYRQCCLLSIILIYNSQWIHPQFFLLVSIQAEKVLEIGLAHGDDWHFCFHQYFFLLLVNIKHETSYQCYSNAHHILAPYMQWIWYHFEWKKNGCFSFHDLNELISDFDEMSIWLSFKPRAKTIRKSNFILQEAKKVH